MESFEVKASAESIFKFFFVFFLTIKEVSLSLFFQASRSKLMVALDSWKSLHFYK